MKSRKVAWAVIALLVAALGAAAVARMPYVYAEVVMTLARMHVQAFPDSQVTSVPVPGLAAGRVVDDYWRVEQIAPDTWAIGEPQSDPDNYEYLLVGSKRALLIDAGSTERDIRPVIAGLTALPVTVIPTHLHFDHTNGLFHFRSVAMIDLPELRARERDGVVRPGRYQLLAPGSRAAREGIRVTEWVPPGRVHRPGWPTGTGALDAGAHYYVPVAA